MIDTHGLVLGELAVREQLISPDQLDAAIAKQEEENYRTKLGQVLVEQGVLPAETVADLLSRQKDAISRYEKTLSASGLFGRLAVEHGFVEEKGLALCIRKQLRLDGEGKKVRIGQILVREGLMSIEQFWKIISLQSSFQCGGCAASLETPRFEKFALLCAKCGHPALVLEDF